MMMERLQSKTSIHDSDGDGNGEADAGDRAEIDVDVTEQPPATDNND